MRLSKFPMALIIAAMVSVTAVTVYLNVSLIPIPVVADPNFTGTLVAGSPYLWRGTASTIQISSNATIAVTYAPVAYVVDVSGPLTNASLGPDAYLIYLKGGRPLLLIANGASVYMFKLVNMSKVNGVTVLVPQYFGINEYLTDQEVQALEQLTGYYGAERVIDVETNGTYIILSLALPQYNVANDHAYIKLPPATAVTSAKYDIAGHGISRTVNGTTVSIYAAPYEYFTIIPQQNAQVTIVVK